MKMLILGAGGIIGQFLRASQPDGVEATYTRRQGSILAPYAGWNYSGDNQSIDLLLAFLQPDAIINLAGENRPDVVERKPAHFIPVNVSLPEFLSWWCDTHGSHLVQVSTQAVFGGEPKLQNAPAHILESFWPPFGPQSPRIPVNAYGGQKLHAEQSVMAAGKRWTIVRPTFVLGVRPDPTVGRQNPVEQMLEPVSTIVVEGEAPAVMRQVADRWFSVSFAWDVAEKLWEVALGEPQRQALHVGIPYRTNRHILASYLRPDINVEPVSHDDFPGLAPRPIDTTYAGEGTWAEIAEGLDRCAREYAARELVAK